MTSDSDAELLERAGIAPPEDPEQGLFAPGCWLRRVSGEPALLFGGGRALLLEVAHPLVAAGVARHSQFRQDPYGRLQRTVDAMSAIVFRDRARALAAVRAVERAHEPVRGSLGFAAGPFGPDSVYSGRDPELVRWVWATLLDTAWQVYQRFVAPFPPGALDAWYVDQAALARLLGVPAALVPADADAFRRWCDETVASDVLTVTDEGREIARAVLDTPTGEIGHFARLMAVGLLPERLRGAFGLPWDDAREAALAALASRVRAGRRGGARPVDAASEPR